MQQDLVSHNWVATVALLSWPAISLLLYKTQPVGKATIWSIITAQLLLPVGVVYKIPMLPQIDKVSISNISILIGCVAFGSRSFSIFKNFGITELLIVTYVLSPIITSELNGDIIVIGNKVLPGVGLYDAISAAIAALIFLIPFFVGRQFLAQTLHIKELLQVLVLAQLVYTLPLLFEIRFSPQLHNWIYGFSPGQFLQGMRFGGFRPMVFMGHGLQAALFLMMSVVAAAALWRLRSSAVKGPAGVVFGYLALVLVLCKSVGATIYAAVLAPLVLFTRPKFQMKIAMLLVSVALLFPVLRTFDVFPTNAMVDASNSFSSDRAQSLQYRFENEDRLLARALERPTFGWGRYGRNRVFDEDSGKDTSVTDGRWIITLGQFGIVGFVAEFGLLAIGVFRAATAFRFARSTVDQILISTLSLIVAINLIDLLPNSGIVPWTLLLCGALLGRAEELKSQAARLRHSQAISTGAEIGTKINANK